jgi:hypothetical protein
MRSDADNKSIDKLYDQPELVYRSALQPGIDTLKDAGLLSAEEAEERLVETAAAFDDAMIPRPLAQRLHSLIVHNEIHPPDQSTVDLWARETRKSVRERYGDVDGERKLETVRQFVNARPGLVEVLNRSGVASHHDLVNALIERCTSLRMTPRQR